MGHRPGPPPAARERGREVQFKDRTPEEISAYFRALSAKGLERRRLRRERLDEAAEHLRQALELIK